jgi:hypothetical protein
MLFLAQAIDKLFEWLRFFITQQCRFDNRTRLRAEWLENRLSPAIFNWSGAISDDWANKANWTENGTVGNVAERWPGQDSHTEDQVNIRDNVQSNCVLRVESALYIAGLSIGGAFAKSVILQSPSALYVQSTTTIAGFFQMDSATLQLAGADLHLAYSTGSWVGGVIRNSQTNTTPGSIDLLGSTLNIRSDAQELGASLWLAEAKDFKNGLTTTTASDVIIQKMNNNLTLYDDASINVGEGCGMYLYQNTNSDTKGGIMLGAGSTNSKIINEGRIKRDADTMDTANNIVYLKVQPPVTNKSTGTFEMAKLSSIEFTNGFTNDGGTFDGDTMRVRLPAGKKLSMSSGLIQLHGTGDYLCLFDGDVELDGGNLFAGDSHPADGAASDFGLVQVTGDLYLGFNSGVFLNVDVSQSGHGDSISAGSSTVDGARLTVRLLNNAPGQWAGTTWVLFTAGSQDGFGWQNDPYDPPSIVGTQYNVPDFYWDGATYIMTTEEV